MDFKTAITLTSGAYKLLEIMGLQKYLSLDNLIINRFQGVYPYLLGYSNKKIALFSSCGKKTTLNFFNQILAANNNSFITNLSKKAELYPFFTSLVRNLPPEFLNRDYYTCAFFEDDIAEYFSLAKFDYLLLGNLFSEENDLDRLIEKRKKIQEAILLNPEIKLVINADDPLFYKIDASGVSKKIFWGFKKIEYHFDDVDLKQKNDLLRCPKCSDILEYKNRFYSHLGSYSCVCGFKRPKLDIEAEAKIYNNYSLLNVFYKGDMYSFKIPIGGIYNAYNALGAIALVLALNIERKVIISSFENYTPLRAHDEIISSGNKKAKVKIIKNPVSMSEALSELYNQRRAKIVFCFDDKGFETTDTSWIWDANFRALEGFFEGKIYIASNRFDDMALRLKYAGVNPSSMIMDSSIKNALSACYLELEEDETMFVLTTPSLVDEVYKVFSCIKSKNKLK